MPLVLRKRAAEGVGRSAQRSDPYVQQRTAACRLAAIPLTLERLALNPSLLLKDAVDRALVFGLAHEIGGEEGLAWSRRLQLIHAGLTTSAAFPSACPNISGRNTAIASAAGANAGSRVADVLRMLAWRLKEQRQAGSRYYIGDALTAGKIYSATSMTRFVPLPPEQCQMDGPTRAAFEFRDDSIEAALDPSCSSTAT